MSNADDDLGEKSEEASQHRRDEWKREGRVFQSKELISAGMLFFMVLTLFMSSKYIFGGMGWIFEDIYSDLLRVVSDDWSVETAISIFSYAVKVFSKIFFPIAITAFIVGIFGSVLQTGFVWSTKTFEMDLGKLSPLKGIKRIFGAEGAFELLKAIVKFILVGSMLYALMSGWVHDATGFWGLEPGQFAVVFGPQLLKVLGSVAIAMMVMAAFDFGFQKYRYEQQIKMTKQESREERKQVEGDPQIKARVRQVQRQIAFQRMAEAVKTADVVITNPTHIAIALVYDREAMFAPKVVAKGADHMAERIKKIARESGVPCVENVPLARALYKAIKLGHFISKDLYNAVAEVLAYVYRLKGRFNR